METQLQSCYFTKKGPELVTLFGYATKSVPGLEINGLGKYGKQIKEKIVFITRTRKLQIPLKRFVLNVEMTDDLGELESGSVKWLEYPLLVHYWFLAGIIPISKLDDCLCIGSLNVNGEIYEPVNQDIINICHDHNYKLISNEKIEYHSTLNEEDLLSHIDQLEFRIVGSDKVKQGLNI